MIRWTMGLAATAMLAAISGAATQTILPEAADGEVRARIAAALADQFPFGPEFMSAWIGRPQAGEAAVFCGEASGRDATARAHATQFVARITDEGLGVVVPEDFPSAYRSVFADLWSRACGPAVQDFAPIRQGPEVHHFGGGPGRF